MWGFVAVGRCVSYKMKGICTDIHVSTIANIFDWKKTMSFQLANQHTSAFWMLCLMHKIQLTCFTYKKQMNERFRVMWVFFPKAFPRSLAKMQCPYSKQYDPGAKMLEFLQLRCLWNCNNVTQATFSCCYWIRKRRQCFTKLMTLQGSLSFLFC